MKRILFIIVIFGAFLSVTSCEDVYLIIPGDEEKPDSSTRLLIRSELLEAVLKPYKV